jgi:uncharacterized FlaG/YvyC family protein
MEFNRTMYINSSVESVLAPNAMPTAASKASPVEGVPKRCLDVGRCGRGEEALRSSEVVVVNEVSRAVKPVRPGDEKPVEETDAAAVPSEEDANKLAQQLEQAINEVHGKQIRFRVQRIQDGSSPVNFAVIDTETGKVVREFPPKELMSLSEGPALQNGHGVLVDEPA